MLCELADDHPESGARMRPGVELFDSLQLDPWWSDAVPDLRRLLINELPTDIVDGWTFTAPVIDMPVYLHWLRRRLADRDIDLTLRHTTDLGDELAHADAVINCTGLGARDLVGDRLVEPVRGQVVVLTNPGLTSWWLHDPAPDQLTYVVPRLDTVVVGGTAEPGADDLTPDSDTAATIMARAVRLVPALAGATMVRHRVGLRPARSEVRLEREERAGGLVIHCYGHGGAGVTLSWGCAAEVVELLTV
jgi:D-amino-acid oxidase